MKFSLRHLFAAMVLVSLAVQGFYVFGLRRYIRFLEHERDGALERLEKTVGPRDFEDRLNRQVLKSYQYPGDVAAAEQRFSALAPGSQGPEQEKRRGAR